MKRAIPAELLPAQVEHRPQDDDGADPLARHRGERARKFVEVANVDDIERHIQSLRSRLEFRKAADFAISLPQNPHSSEFGNDLRQQSKVLGEHQDSHQWSSQ